ncbi:hypothetical protein BKA61DRAFT_670217 [Leptodontidium sp. MPI-SDFR-AT-0119]|nr:hypothetical protein BKA61DRAFT_670217 [Leptodontidium sp. MPI-SDFR-AT-0119]
MSSNDRLQRAPKNPMSDEKYKARYGTPRKCMYCTNSKRGCTGGKPCDICQNAGRVCKDVKGNSYATGPDNDLKTKVVDKANKRKRADTNCKEEGEESQERELNGTVEGQGVDEHTWEVQTGEMGYTEHRIHQGDVLLAQQRFSPHRPQRVRMTAAIPPLDDVNPRNATEQDGHNYGQNYEAAGPHPATAQSSVRSSAFVTPFPEVNNTRHANSKRRIEAGDKHVSATSPSQWDLAIDRVWNHTGGTDASRAEAKASMNEPLGEKIISWAERMKDPDKYFWSELLDKPVKVRRPAPKSRSKAPVQKPSKGKRPSENKERGSEYEEELGSDYEV